MPRRERSITVNDLEKVEENIAATTSRAFTGVQKQIDGIRRDIVTKKALRTELRSSERRIIAAIKQHTPRIDVEREVELLKDRLANLEHAIGIGT